MTPRERHLHRALLSVAIVSPYAALGPVYGESGMQARVCTVRIHTRELCIARRMAEQLVFEHSIPPFEVSLVPWFTDKPASHNVDGLALWVYGQITLLKLAFDANARSVIDTLASRLQRLLAYSGEEFRW